MFSADDVFRIDHYLGKETVQNILALRFANTLFEPIWNANYVDSVQITMAEDVGIGGRAGFYEKTGAARDVLLGDATLFPRNTEVEASWTVIDPLEEFWAGTTPHPYRAGEWGPRAADEMLAAEGRRWRRP